MRGLGKYMSGKKKKLQKKEAEKDQMIDEIARQEEKAPETSQGILTEQADLGKVSAEQVQKLEEELGVLRAESKQMQEELQKIKDHRRIWNRRFYRELLDSEVLGAVSACYVEMNGKKELYQTIRAYFDGHVEDQDAMRAELRAVRERWRSGNISSLACATGILSVAGLVFAAAGTTPGAVIVLFLVLIVLAGYIWINAESAAKVGCCAEYLLTVLEDSVNIKNCKKIPNSY